jgi:hypothetical protein
MPRFYFGGAAARGATPRYPLAELRWGQTGPWPAHVFDKINYDSYASKAQPISRLARLLRLTLPASFCAEEEEARPGESGDLEI